MCKSDFGEEFPIFITLERLFRRAVRSEAARTHCLRDAELKQSKKIKTVLNLHIRFCPEGESYMEPLKNYENSWLV
jgi:hypothetical protein